MTTPLKHTFSFDIKIVILHLTVQRSIIQLTGQPKYPLVNKRKIKKFPCHYQSVEYKSIIIIYKFNQLLLKSVEKFQDKIIYQISVEFFFNLFIVELKIEKTAGKIF